MHVMAAWSDLSAMIPKLFSITLICLLLRNRALRYPGGRFRQTLRLASTSKFSDEEIEKRTLQSADALMKAVMSAYEEGMSSKYKMPSKEIIFASIFGVKIPKSSAEFKNYVRDGLLTIDDDEEESDAVPILIPISLKAVSKKEVASDPQAKLFYEAIGRIYGVLKGEKFFTLGVVGTNLEILYREWMRVRIAASVGFPKEPMTMSRLLGIDGALRALQDHPNQLLESIRTRLHSSLQLQSSYDISETTLQHSSREVSDRAAFIAELEKVPVDRRQPIAFIRPHSDPLKKGEFWDLCLKVRYTPATAATVTSKEEGEEEHSYYIFVDNKTAASEWGWESHSKDDFVPERRYSTQSLERRPPPPQHQHLSEVFGCATSAASSAGSASSTATSTAGGSSTGGIEYVYLYMGDVGYSSLVLDTHSMLLAAGFNHDFFGPNFDWYETVFEELSRRHFFLRHPEAAAVAGGGGVAADLRDHNITTPTGAGGGDGKKEGGGSH